jgi:hypothetical protein
VILDLGGQDRDGCVIVEDENLFEAVAHLHPGETQAAFQRHVAG